METGRGRCMDVVVPWKLAVVDAWMDLAID